MDFPKHPRCRNALLLAGVLDKSFVFGVGEGFLQRSQRPRMPWCGQREQRSGAVRPPSGQVAVARLDSVGAGGVAQEFLNQQQNSTRSDGSCRLRARRFVAPHRAQVSASFSVNGYV
jgi:hypothetical protein